MPWLGLIFATLLPLLVVYTIYRIVRRGFEVKVLLERGVEGRARVVRKLTFSAPNPAWHRVIYTFEGPDGGTYKNRSMFDRDAFEALSEGDEIPILYLPDRASVNAPKWLIERSRLKPSA